MNLDVWSLHTFSWLAHPGAEKIVGSPTMLAGIDTYVNVTKAELGAKSDAEDEFVEHDLMSIHIGFSGGLNSYTVLAFSPEFVEWLVDALTPGIDAIGADDELAENNPKEVVNIVLGGFIDSWADYLDTIVDITTPTYTDDENSSPLDRVDIEELENGGDNEHVLIFRNQLEVAGNAIKFDLHMVPTASSIETIIEASGDDDVLPVESFIVFPRVINDGATQTPEDITAMMGIDTTAEVNRLSFIPIEGASMSLADAVRHGAVLEFSRILGGYIVILFDESSAENIASSLLPGVEGDEAMRQSVIQEIGDTVTSGFLDGWANALETTIGISSPRHIRDIGPAVIDSLATDLAQSQEYILLIDSTIRTDDNESICDTHAFPGEAESHKAPEQLSPAA